MRLLEGGPLQPPPLSLPSLRARPYSRRHQETCSCLETNAEKRDPPSKLNTSNASKRDFDDIPKLELGTDNDDDDDDHHHQVNYRVRKKFTGDGFSLLTSLLGHQKVITGITLATGSDKSYSGSQDNTVLVWDCNTGQCVNTINLESEVGCMIGEGPWNFAGIKNAVKTWNTQTLTGPTLRVTDPIGIVYALLFHKQMLFAATQNGCILVWKLNAANNSSVTGHQSAVVSLVIGAGRLYSGSMDTTIRVWDLKTLQCINILSSHTSVVMSLLCWDQFLISCSLDQTIKAWGFNEWRKK